MVVVAVRGGVVNPTNIKNDVCGVEHLWIPGTHDCGIRVQVCEEGNAEDVVSMEFSVVGRNNHVPTLRCSVHCTRGSEELYVHHHDGVVS